MKSNKTSLHIILALTKLDDKGRIDLATNLKTMAPTSALYTQNPAIQAAVTECTGNGALLGAIDAEVTNDEAKLALSKEKRENLRAAFDKSAIVVKSLVEHHGTTVEEAASLGFISQIGKTPPAPLATPNGVTVKLGKKHGQFRVSADTPGHGKFGAQISPNPIGPGTWQDLPGTGKTHLVTGYASGTELWVRFRSVSSKAVSDFCTPVLVTVP